MATRVRAGIWTCFGAAVLLAAFGVLRNVQRIGIMQDPDWHFHLALSRLGLARFPVRQVPQLTGLGWDRQFVDKEFLFHALTTAGTAAAGDAGFYLVSALPTVATLIFLLLAARRGVGPLGAVALVGLGTLGTAEFAKRLLFVRPHTLGVACFCALWLALLARRRGWAAAAGLAYALAYHAFYLPLTLCAVAMALGLRHDRRLVGSGAAGALGIGAGVFLNPYFPETLRLTWIHLGIALSRPASEGLDYGAELIPLSGNVFLSAFAVPLLLFTLAAVISLARARRGAAADLDGDVALATAGIFWVATLQSPRGVEYAVPATVIALSRLWPASRDGRLAQAAACALALLHVAAALAFWRSEPAENTAHDGVRAAVAHIPRDGGLVFNCEWYLTPPLLLERPDLRVLDALDPSLLVAAAPGLAAERRAFNRGELPDPWALMRRIGARWVLSREARVVERLEREPGFARRYPRDFAEVTRVSEQPFLYEVLPEPRTAFAVSWRAWSPPPAAVINLPAIASARDVPWETLSPAAGAAWLDLASYVAARGHAPPAGSASCVRLQPAAAEIDAHRGAGWLGVGGGRSVRVWFNGRPLFTSVRFFEEPRLVQALIPLPSPLAPGDRVDLLACSARGAPYHGAALSFWTDRDLISFATAKGLNTLWAPPDPTPWGWKAPFSPVGPAPAALPVPAQSLIGTSRGEGS